jgi:hypothetical protein
MMALTTTLMDYSYSHKKLTTQKKTYGNVIKEEVTPSPPTYMEKFLTNCLWPYVRIKMCILYNSEPTTATN